MRRRKVRVVGNCQASAIANFYREFVGAAAGEDVEYIDDLGMDTPALRAAVADADLVIVQERDFKHGLTKEELGGDKDVFTFPMIVAGFLWPFANEPHLHNRAERPISDGPYPPQMGDSYLNRLIADGVSPEDALDRYLALDIGRAAHLDRMTELYLDRQRERDQATGYEIAGFIEANFRHRKLFLTAEHPDACLFAVVAEQLFRHMGLPSDLVDRAIGSLFRSPFPGTELALHPGVIAHFGLTFADNETRYNFFEEGSFTFREHVLRYMRFDNNAPLRHVLYGIEAMPPAEGLLALDAALQASPQSSLGLRHRGRLLQKLGRFDEARAAFRAGVAAKTHNPDPYLELARFLIEDGNLIAARETVEQALKIAPPYGAAHLLHGQILLLMGGTEEGIAALHRVAQFAHTPHMFRILGIAFGSAGETATALRFARRGLAAEPANPDQSNLIAEILEQQGRRATALRFLKYGRHRGRANDQTYSLLGHFQLRAGAFAEAEESFRLGFELHGEHRPDLHDGLLQARSLRAAG